jgi:FtsH-binding integral membrane protein
VPPSPPTDGALSADDRKWLHDKYERLAAEEIQLSSNRTTYFAAIGTVLVTGILVALADLLYDPLLFATVVTFLAALGIMISMNWVVLLHRTNDAQNLWREAAFRLETADPPLEGVLMAPITLRSKQQLEVDLLRPYTVHRLRFSNSKSISWMDRIDPAFLTETLPMAFLTVWVVSLISVWIWFLLYH